MEWPFYKQGAVYFPFGLLDINDCPFGDFQQLFPQVPNEFYPVKDEVVLFYFDCVLGEVKAFFDIEVDALLEFDLELFEDIDLRQFLDQLKVQGVQRYTYMEYNGATFLVFGRCFIARLNKNNDKVACLVFLNIDYVNNDKTIVSDRIRQAASQINYLM